MPPKMRPGRRKQDTIKTDIADKVREIKQRQENWMKQRENSLDTLKRPASSDDSKLQGHVGDSQNVLAVKRSTNPRPYSGSDVQSKAKSSSQITQKSMQDSGICLEDDKCSTGKAINAQFHNWVKTRAESGEGDTCSEASDCNTGRNSKSVNRLPFNSQDVQVADDLDVHPQNKSQTSSQPRQPLSPEMFDSLADQIVNRVKTELKLSQSQPQKLLRKTYEAKDYDKQEPAEPADSLNRSAPAFDTHYCPHCSKLMVPPSHSPMLVIPCGHTFCEVCIGEQSLCPGCGRQVSSLTGNLMLQQIILDVTAGKTHETSSGTTSSSQYHNSRVKSPKKRTAADYEEEYRTLTMRCEVLDAEADSIREQVQHIKQQINSEQKQMSHIAREEERVCEQMRHLEEQLNQLRSHREEYANHCVELEEQQEEHRRRLGLVNDTLKQLHRDRDRVKSLAQKS